MGWFGVPLNAGTVTVAGIALGLIVDDTIHVIHSFAEARDQPPLEAIVSTLHGSGKPILITSVAVALGFGLFGFAAFQPTRYFGLLTALTSLLALFADLVILPALLLRREEHIGPSSGDRRSYKSRALVTPHQPPAEAL